MRVRSEKSTWLILILLCATRSSLAEEVVTVTSTEATTIANNATKELLKASETGEPKKVEIVKQIKRINDDGSYTVGYEAGDGTFKIESRDVRGYVKGTYGYIDEDGEIKRVTYSSSNITSSPPSSTTTPSPRHNKTAAFTTRRPLPTIVYPRGSSSTRATVIQPIPRRRIATTTTTRTIVTTTAPDYQSTPAYNVLPKSDASAKDTVTYTFPSRTEHTLMKPVQLPTRTSSEMPTLRELMTKQSTTETTTRFYPTYKPVYENDEDKTSAEKIVPTGNTLRRQLTSTSHDTERMVMLRQSSGDDSTDVYGNSLSVGTVRPLFTTTTPRTRLVPYQTLLTSRQNLHEHIQQIPTTQETVYQENNIEANTDRPIESENIGMSSSIPLTHIPTHRDAADERVYQQPIYRQRPTVEFKTREYLRDHPGEAIPIGNQRPLYRFQYQEQPSTNEQFIRESAPIPYASANAAPPDSTTSIPYMVNQQPVTTRIIPIPVDQQGVPIAGYRNRIAYEPFYSQAAHHGSRSQSAPLVPEAVPHITTPVSTRDLKRLLQLLLVRQSRLQTLMDIRDEMSEPYQPLYRNPNSRQFNIDYLSRQQFYNQRNGYQANYVPHQRSYAIQAARNSFQYDNYKMPSSESYINRENYAQQQDIYSNQVPSYEQESRYESQRFVPRRRFYRPSSNYDQRYESETASSNQVQDQPEFLPPDIREALLLKMLMLAINPDFMTPPTEVAPTEMAARMPVYTKKKVRNVQILGEEGSVDSNMMRDMRDLQ